MALVLGIDSSTQSCKALLVDAEDGRIVEERRAAHPGGTEVDPRSWLAAVDEAAGPLMDRADAVSVGGQQHGMVLLDEAGEVVRPALLWNDTRSAPEARDLVEEMGGPEECVQEIGSVLVASFTAAKLRWIRDHDTDSARRAAAVLLPHDYVSWHLAQGDATRGGDLDLAFTDHGDASGTGYRSLRTGDWSMELLERSLGRPARLPTLPDAPQQVMGRTPGGAVLAAGTGDNMGAALGLSLRPGDLSVSIGTSGVCAMVSESAPADPTGTVTGFADASGRFLPMTTTINAARILEVGRTLLGVYWEEFSRLALTSTPGAGGATLLPYFDGERTPNRPEARATFSGLSGETSRADLARACVEGLLCSLADGIAALEERAATRAGTITLIGGAAQNPAVRELAPAILGREVSIAPEGEYVALGAARQAAWALSGETEPPVWGISGARTMQAEATPQVMEAYQELKGRTAHW